MHFHKQVGAMLVMALVAAPARAATLELRLGNLRPTETVRVEIYRDALSWAGGAPMATRVLAARAPAQTVRIEGLPPGRYAVRVHQDPNPGGLAEPPSFSRERKGSSRNPGRLGAPDFERAAVELGEADVRLPIHMFVSSRY